MLTNCWFHIKHKRSLGIILAAWNLVKKLLCESYRVCLSFKRFSLIAWYPVYLELWYVDDRRSEFRFTGSSIEAAVEGLLKRIYGVFSFSRTLFLLLLLVYSCFRRFEKLYSLPASNILF